VSPRCLDVLLRLHLNMRTHLLVHLRVELALLKQRAESKLRFSPPVHGLWGSQLRRFQNQIDGRRKALPIRGLFDKLLATRRSQLIQEIDFDLPLQNVKG